MDTVEAILVYKIYMQKCSTPTSAKDFFLSSAKNSAKQFWIQVCEIVSMAFILSYQQIFDLIKRPTKH